MNDDADQTVVPASFTSLFVPPGRLRPTETRDVIAARHDLCEDLAQMLVDLALARLFELQTDRGDVLQRIRRGLLDEGTATVTAIEPIEADWVVRRLAELLEWPQPVVPSQ